MNLIVKQDLEKLPQSAVKLTLTLSKDSSRKEYNDLLTRISKDAALPGFRKGHVPPSVLEKKFGEGIKAEAVQNLLDKALQEAFETVELKPISFSTPRVLNEELSLDLEKDLVVSLQYDTYPDFKIADYQSLEIEEPQVQIAKKDEDRELDHIREQNAMVIDKTSGVVAKNDTVTVNFVELDDKGQELAVTRRQDFVFTVGTGYNYYKFDEDIEGAKKGEEKVFTKDYPADFEVQDLAGTKKTLKVTVTAVKEKKLPDLNDELAQDVSDEFKTLEDLRQSIRSRLEKAAASRVRQKNQEAILEKIAAGTPIEVPESMILAEMEQSWRSFAAQSRMSPEQLTNLLGAEGKEKMFGTWRPESEKALKHRLIMEKIIELEKFEASAEEVEEEIKRQADASKSTVEETREYFEKNDLMHYLEHDVKDRKLTDFLLSRTKMKKGKKIDYLDLMGVKE